MQDKTHPIPKNCHCCKNGKYKPMKDLLGLKGVHFEQDSHILYVREHAPFDTLLRVTENNQYVFKGRTPVRNNPYGQICRLPAIITYPDDFADTYICTNPVCKHIYRNYFEDISEFHADGGIREKQSTEGTKLLDRGPPEKIELKRQRAQTQFDMIMNFMDKDYNVIEIAPGRGFFLGVIKNYFNSISGVDIDPKVIAHNKILYDNIDIQLYNVLDMPENQKYDVVFAFDILEHLENINKFALKAHALANKYIVVQVPIGRPIVPPNYHLLKNPKEHHTPFDGHLHYFSQFSLNNLLTKDGLFECVLMYKTHPFETAGGRELLTVFKKVSKQ